MFLYANGRQFILYFSFTLGLEETSEGWGRVGGWVGGGFMSCTNTNTQKKGSFFPWSKSANQKS